MRPALLLALILVVASPQTTKAQGELQIAKLGECALESGEVIQDCQVGYRTLGQLNADRSNAVLFIPGLTRTSAIGTYGTLDGSRYFIIVVDPLGNGVSSSPSNSAAQPGAAFPQITIRDIVVSQYRLLTEQLGFSSLRAVMGVSMGGLTAFEWAVSYPGFAEKVIPILGSPRLTTHDIVLWETVRHALALYEECQCSEAAAVAGGLIFLTMNTPDYHARATPRDAASSVLGGLEQPLGRPLTVPVAQDVSAQIRAVLDHNVAAPFSDSMEQVASRVEADVLVITAARDHMVHPAPAMEFARLIGAETLELKSDCGHAFFACEMKEVIQAVQQFLARED